MKVYFIGIGGIGISALAQYYLSKGAEISGSDLVASEITDFLKKKGIKIVAIVDSNINPDIADYPIPANDDAISAVSYIIDKIRQTIINSKQAK